MKISTNEVSVFRAVVKAFGIYQLVLVGTDAMVIILEKTDVTHVPFGGHGRQTEYVVWAAFHLAVALILLFGTASACRLAFLRDDLE
jgi:hypothetical protein